MSRQNLPIAPLVLSIVGILMPFTIFLFGNLAYAKFYVAVILIGFLISLFSYIKSRNIKNARILAILGMVLNVLPVLIYIELLIFANRADGL